MIKRAFHRLFNHKKASEHSMNPIVKEDSPKSLDITAIDKVLPKTPDENVPLTFGKSKVWYFDNDLSKDQRLPHQAKDQDGNTQFLSVEKACQLSNVEYFNINVDSASWKDELDEFCTKRNYKNRDELTVRKDTLPNYDEKIKIFFEEHIHEDEEIRFILGGSGYFDVRDCNDMWIRFFVERNDLLVLPAGIYHRFTLDTNDFIHVIRVFKDEPKWIAINRPLADDNEVRNDYLKSIGGKISDDWKLTTSAPLVAEE